MLGFFFNADSHHAPSDSCISVSPRNKAQETKLQTTSQRLEQAHLKWYAKIHKSKENLNNGWKNLAQYEGFDKFQILLEQLMNKEFEKKVSPHEVVHIIQSVIDFPLTRQIIFKMLQASDDSVMDKFNLALGYADFGKCCLSWYQRAGQSTDDLHLRLDSLEQGAKFNEFTDLLKFLLKEEVVAEKINAAEAIEVIEIFIESSFVRRVILKEAYLSTQDCHDRAVSTFKRIQGFARFAHHENQNASPQALLKVSEEILRNTLVCESAIPVMHKQWNEERLRGNESNDGPLLKEELEYQMLLCHVLKKDFNLPFTAKPHFTQKCIDWNTMVELTESDIACAQAYVNECLQNKESLINRLITQPVWRNYLQTRHWSEIVILQNKHINLIEKCRDSKEVTEASFRQQAKNGEANLTREINTILKYHTRRLLEEREHNHLHGAIKPSFATVRA